MEKYTNHLELIIKHFPIKQWNWEIIWKNPNITIDFLVEMEINLPYDCCKALYGRHLPFMKDKKLIKLINEYIKRDGWLDWSILSKNLPITPKIIEKYIDKWDWDMLSKNTNITLEIIEKYINKFDVKFIYECTPFYKYITSNSKFLYWLSINPYLTSGIIIKHKNYDWDWQRIANNKFEKNSKIIKLKEQHAKKYIHKKLLNPQYGLILPVELNRLICDYTY